MRWACKFKMADGHDFYWVPHSEVWIYPQGVGKSSLQLWEGSGHWFIARKTQGSWRRISGKRAGDPRWPPTRNGRTRCRRSVPVVLKLLRLPWDWHTLPVWLLFQWRNRQQIAENIEHADSPWDYYAITAHDNHADVENARTSGAIQPAIQPAIDARFQWDSFATNPPRALIWIVKGLLKITQGALTPALPRILVNVIVVPLYLFR